MSLLYQKWDNPVFNYDLWAWSHKSGVLDEYFYNEELRDIPMWWGPKFKVDWPKHGLWLRGPKPTGERDSVSLIGSAGFFGRFVHEPFANQIEKNLNLDVYNFSNGGAGPDNRMFKSDNFFEKVNQSKVCVIHVMSGRSIGNSKWNISKSGDDMNGLFEEHPDYVPSLSGTYKGKIHVREFWKYAYENYDFKTLKQLYKESLENYVKAYEIMFSKIKVPKILVFNEVRWNGKDNMGRKPILECKTKEEIVKYHPNPYPQFIFRTSPELWKLIDMCENFVSLCHHESEKFDSTTDDGKSCNEYYPTQYAHDVIYSKLEPIIKGYCF